MFGFSVIGGPDSKMLHRAHAEYEQGHKIYFTFQALRSEGDNGFGRPFRVYGQINGLEKRGFPAFTRYVTFEPVLNRVRPFDLKGRYDTETRKGLFFWDSPFPDVIFKTPPQWLGFDTKLLEVLENAEIDTLACLLSKTESSLARVFADYETIHGQFQMTNEIAHRSASKTVRLRDHLLALGFRLKSDGTPRT